MSLIFDSFKSRTDAEKFATHVTKTFKRETVVYDSQEESQGYNAANAIDDPKSKDSFQLMQEGQLVDVFPFQLNPPIVLVERNLLHDGVLADVDSEKELKTEEQIEQSVTTFGGVFAGT